LPHVFRISTRTMGSIRNPPAARDVNMPPAITSNSRRTMSGQSSRRVPGYFPAPKSCAGPPYALRLKARKCPHNSPRTQRSSHIRKLNASTRTEFCPERQCEFPIFPSVPLTHRRRDHDKVPRPASTRGKKSLKPPNMPACHPAVAKENRHNLFRHCFFTAKPGHIRI